MSIPEGHEEMLRSIWRETKDLHSDVEASLRQLRKTKEGSISTPSGERKVVEGKDLEKLNKRVGVELSLIQKTVEMLEKHDFKGRAELLNEVQEIASDLNDVVKEQKKLLKEELRSNPDHKSAFDSTKRQAKQINQLIKDQSKSMMLEGILDDVRILHADVTDKMDELKTRKGSLSTPSGKKRVVSNVDLQSLNKRMGVEIGLIQRTVKLLEETDTEKNKHLFEEVKTIAFELQEIVGAQKKLFREEFRSNPEEKAAFRTTSQKAQEIHQFIQSLSSSSGEIAPVKEKRSQEANDDLIVDKLVQENPDIKLADDFRETILRGLRNKREKT